MTGFRGRWLPLTVLVAAVAALIVSLVWAAGGGSPSWQSGPRAMMGVVTRSGAVHNLSDADRAAARFADRWGLRVGEVMQFSNGYYAQLLASDGGRATEVLIDPGSGTVRLEFGPAMMWNTAYGMMPGPRQSGAVAIAPDQAVRIADRWLSEHHTGLHAAEPDRFPGYYTLHTLRGDRIVGMLSVNSGTGDVWYHAWHGRFIQMREQPNKT
ncbi:hypothetical protein AV521_19750 [Streptomyces sp. IMTB 2501]|uniref:hypothetical protein n=1 Tax=Streptomyces sp. IMTB 2501 TaxID=1776340 RepID=UPI00096C16B9|nr:hypothetical protein [Streptomyces sp. IMTB 2501]OLZ68996.1 hypothetical protein AV521_19750 [Streptomyces sp. IMTB 2501]